MWYKPLVKAGAMLVCIAAVAILGGEVDECTLTVCKSLSELLVH